ncbi:MAG: shikimate kinase [Blautia sp.]|nr:shikimate kinase [Blautia sp.]
MVIFLIGFMGSGKSTISHFLESYRGYERIEMDEKIETEEGMKISRIFAERGETYFRQLETELLNKLEVKGDFVVSCGGGTAMREENVRIMKEKGVIVYLKASPETVFGHVRYSRNRPLLDGRMNLEYITSLLEKRRPAYEAAAQVTVCTDGKKIHEIADEILIAVRSFE